MFLSCVQDSGYRSAKKKKKKDINTHTYMKCPLFSYKLAEVCLDVLMKGQQWDNNGIIKPILFSEGCTWGIRVQQCL